MATSTTGSYWLMRVGDTIVNEREGKGKERKEKKRRVVVLGLRAARRQRAGINQDERWLTWPDRAPSYCFNRVIRTGSPLQAPPCLRFAQSQTDGEPSQKDFRAGVTALEHVVHHGGCTQRHIALPQKSPVKMCVAIWRYTRAKLSAGHPSGLDVRHRIAE